MVVSFGVEHCELEAGGTTPPRGVPIADMGVEEVEVDVVTLTRCRGRLRGLEFRFEDCGFGWPLWPLLHVWWA